MKSLVTGIAAVATLITSLSALAYEPASSPASNDFTSALNRCRSYVTAKKSPGDVSETDYQEYVELRDKALAADPQLVEWDKETLGIVPKNMYLKCEKLFADYVAGVDAEKKPTLLTSCVHNVDSRLNSITQTYYPEFEAKKRDYGLTFPRKDLEVARYYMYKKDGWFSTGGCATNDHYKKAFEPLREKFATAEAMVLKMEAAKGARFERVDRKGTTHNLIFVDSKTGKQLPNSALNASN